MRFVAALDTIIFGVSYAQGAEVNTAGWTRKMLLQFLGNGIIQAAHLTAGAISDRIVFEGDGVTYEVNGEGKVVVTIAPPAPAFADLPDVDMTGVDDGDVPVWDAAADVWRAGVAVATSTAREHAFRSEQSTWTAQPAADTEYLGATLWRTRLDLASATQARFLLVVAAAATATATLRAQYTTDTTGAGGWTDVTGLSVNALNVVGLKTSSWQTLPTSAKADCLWRILGAGGNGSTAPQFAMPRLQVR